eukprot:6477979-Amphidinium_carterae.1
MLKFMCGADGASAIKAIFVDKCLCSHSVRIELDAAVTKAIELCQGTGVNWSGAAVKAEVMEARDMIRRLKQGQAILKGAEVTPWLSRVASLMLPWITEVVTMKGEGEGVAEKQSTLHGMEALKAKYTKFATQGCKSVDELTVFSTWRHLLSPTELQAVAAKRDS